MQSPLRPRNWVIFILVNIFVSALTAFIVVRAVTQAANRSLLDAAAAPPAAVAQAPAQAPATALVATADPASQPAPAPDAQAQGAATAPASQPQADASPANALAPLETPVADATQPASAAVAPVVTATVAQPAPAASTAANVRISTVVYPGQRTREAVVIVNEGDQVDMTGWTLSNPRGQIYSFGSVLLFKDSFINLHTTSGVDVPTDLFWNRDEAAWQVGDVATLKRGEETVATFTVK
jgi:cell wall-associated NlpC family hydrolase